MAEGTIKKDSMASSSPRTEKLTVTDFFLGPSNIESHPHRPHDGGSDGFSGSTPSSARCSSSSTSIVSASSAPTTRTRDKTSLEQRDVGINLDVTPDDGYLALGTISLVPVDDISSEPRFSMIGDDSTDEFPNQLLITATRKGWIRFDDFSNAYENNISRRRVYVLPGDVDRGNRGNLVDFRKTIKYLLKFVDKCPDAWAGKADDNSQPLRYDVPKTEELESLFYVFNTLRSPCANLDAIQHSVYGYQAVSDVINDCIAGLKTVLYPYQRRSIAAMVQRESDPARILDPRKIAMRDIYGKPFYLDFHDGTLLRNPTFYTEPKGGILAETMGYGKTLCIIALILATRGHYPKIPEDRVDTISIPSSTKVGSLLAMAARRAKHEGVPWKAEFHALRREGYHYETCLQVLDKYNRSYEEPIFTPTTAYRKGKREANNLVYLCSATLIIVPPNLLVQWQSEIQKHTEDDALDVLVLDAPTAVIPTWRELLKYDVVIITKARFEQEYRDDDLNQGKTIRGAARYSSPLTQLRWLRVVCDEGHGFAGSSSKTNAMAMLDKMFIERRWIVSGTPSSTLHGVEVGLATTISPNEEHADDYVSQDAKVSGRRKSIAFALQRGRVPIAQVQELKDLERLRLIVVNFLRLQPWANQRGNDMAQWKRYLAPVTEEGVRQTAPALRDVLQTLIIRHRIEDIDTDLTLPPLHTKIVHLEPSYHDKLAINMFVLVLISNYITSEREDEDYMFHPRNRRKLDQLINNLRHATFHWVGFSEHDIRETLKISNEYLNKNLDQICDVDKALLREGIVNAQRALTNPTWKAFSNLHEMGVYVDEFPNQCGGSWSLDGREEEPVLMGTVQAREAQRYFKERVFKQKLDLFAGLGGTGVKVMLQAHKRAEEERQDRKHKSKDEEMERQVGAAEEPKLKTALGSSSSRDKSSIPQKRRRSSQTLGKTVSQDPPAETITLDEARLPSTFVSGFSSSKLSYLINELLMHTKESKSIVFYSGNNTAFWVAEAMELMHIPFLIYANTLSVAQRNNYLSTFNTDETIRVLLMDLKQASHGLHVACANRVYIIEPIWDRGVESQAIKRAHRIGQTKDVYVETLVLQGTFEEELVKRRRDIDRYRDDRTRTATRADQGKDWGQRESTMAEEDLPEPMASEACELTSSGVAPSKTAKKRVSASKDKSLLDDRHMVQVLKNIKFMKFTSAEEHNVTTHIARLDIPKQDRLLFGGLVPLKKSASGIDTSSNPTQSATDQRSPPAVASYFPPRGPQTELQTQNRCRAEIPVVALGRGEPSQAPISKSSNNRDLRIVLPVTKTNSTQRIIYPLKCDGAKKDLAIEVPTPPMRMGMGQEQEEEPDAAASLAYKPNFSPINPSINSTSDRGPGPVSDSRDQHRATISTDDDLAEDDENEQERREDNTKKDPDPTVMPPPAKKLKLNFDVDAKMTVT